MTKKIIQKVCGLAVSAAMALGSIAGSVAEVRAEESAVLAGAGAEENVQPEEDPVLYRITLPWTEHLTMEPETDHIFIPDPDMRTEEEMRDILLVYEAGEEVEIGIRAEDAWQITKLSFLDGKKEENGYEWKDQTTVHFYMPEKNLVMKAELAGMEIPEAVPQEAAQDASADTDPLQQTEVQPAEPQNGAADPAASPDARQVEGTALQTSDGAGDAQETGSGTGAVPEDGDGTGAQANEPGLAADPSQNPGNGEGSAQENTQQPGEAGMGSESGIPADAENGTAIETEPSMTYIPEKDADGLPVQGSIEQTETLEIVRNDAGFDAKIDLRNVSYDPEQYMVEYISDDILLDTLGTYSCIYKVTDPDSGKFFFVLRPVKVVEEQDLASAPDDQDGSGTGADPAVQGAASSEAGEDQQADTQTAETGLEQQTEKTVETQTTESTTEASSETGAALEAAAADETEQDAGAGAETETETEQSSGEYKVTLTEGEDLGVELDHEDGTYNAGETVTFTTDNSQDALIAAAALKDESNRVQDTADILYSEISFNEAQDSFSFEMPAENVSLAVSRDEETGKGIMLMAAADEDDESWDDQTDVEAGSYYYFSDGKTHPFSTDMGSGGDDSYKYVRYKVDGVTYTVNAYCMQHSETAPPSGTTYTSMTELDEGGDDVYLRKALFYGYGGPGWGGTFGGQNIKSIMKDTYGVGKETRAMQHYIVDYLYDGESGFGGSLSDKAKKMIKAVKAALKVMPDPAAVSLTPGLATTSDGNVTSGFTWNADPAYILTVTLEPGVVLVNDSTGARTGGAASVSGGQTFHLEATGENTDLTGQYPLTCNYPFDFHAMLLKLKKSQDIGFGYYTNGAGLTLKVKWELKKPFEIQKIDAPTGKAAPYNSRYSFSGMQFTVYKDAGLTQPVTTVTTDASGHGKSEPLFYGTYYGKETKAPTGYIASDHVFTIVIGQNVTVDGAEAGTVNVSDDIIRKRIGIRKHDRETGKAEPYASSYVGRLGYVWGGNDLSSGTDCSGFVQAVFASYGVNLPRLAQEQGSCGQEIGSLEEARAGDVVYWGGGPHVGIYLGDGKVVECHGNESNTVDNPGQGPTIRDAGYMEITSIRRFLIEAPDMQGAGGNRTDPTPYMQKQLELIWAIVAQEDNGSYEGALAVISSAMNRTESAKWGYEGGNALAQLTAAGQYCYSMDNYWIPRLDGNVPAYVKQAVYDCLNNGIRNHRYTSFRSRRQKTAGADAVQVGGNWYFDS